MKPGYKTTEFWLSLIAVLVGAVQSSGLLEQTQTEVDNQVVGMVVAVLGALGYAVSRAFTKASADKKEVLTAAANPPKASD